MAFFPACIFSQDGVAIADHVQVWMTFFRLGNTDRWDGSFLAPVTTPLTQPTYRIRLADGREGTMTHIMTQISGDNITVYFAGEGPALAGGPIPHLRRSPETVCQESRRLRERSHQLLGHIKHLLHETEQRSKAIKTRSDKARARFDHPE